jgi:hypothetical protein
MTGLGIQTSKHDLSLHSFFTAVDFHHDRMITVDIQRFSTNLAAIYSNLAKPVLDVILYNYQLSRNVGAEGILLLTLLVQSSAALRKSNNSSTPQI